MIASTYRVHHLQPHGTHPDLDPWYSAPDLEFRHDLAEASRYEKTALITEWPTAIANLRVCLRSEGAPTGEPNCGECRKCMLTLLTFIGLDRPDAAKNFPRAELDASDVMTKYQLNHLSAPFARELIEPLRHAGRSDLADAVEDQLVAYRRRSRSFSNVLRNAERTVLRGGVRRTLRRMRLRRGTS